MLGIRWGKMPHLQGAVLWGLNMLGIRWGIDRVWGLRVGLIFGAAFKAEELVAEG